MEKKAEHCMIILLKVYFFLKLHTVLEPFVSANLKDLGSHSEYDYLKLECADQGKHSDSDLILYTWYQETTPIAHDDARFFIDSQSKNYSSI